MKNIGIWLDKDKALIVTLENESEQLRKIESNIEHYNIGGGSGSRFKGGPQDVVQDSKYLEREKQQFKLYFKTIVSEIKEADALALFGPAETFEKFNKELKENHSQLGAKIKTMKKADSMTDNQVKALVRAFFQS